MANRVKEDEKNERIIRSLLKLPENRRCINCNSLGPQYVCTNFSIFICTTCSGIHREFTHRVKSISMAKFTLQEVSALQGGGNASAKEIYFKEWDPQRHSIPDSSNVERLRDFIKHVYVDRRYTGEKSLDKPPRSKMGETDFSENRKVDTYQVGSRILPYEDTYERRYSEGPSPGGRSDDKNYRTSYDERRSPGSDSDYRSPTRTEIVNDWRRDDRFGNGRRSEDSRISDGGSKLEVRSPDHQRDLDVSSPPVVRPVRDILGENVSPLRIIEPPKPDGGRPVDSSVHTQSTVSSSSLASSNGNRTELRMESSLIDFDAVPEPPLTTALPNTQQTAIGLSVLQPTSSSNDNWANFDSVPEVKVSQAPSNSNLLESVLSELSVPAPSPSPASGGASINQPVANMSMLSSSNSFFNVVDGAPWHSVHPQQHSLVPATGTQTPAQPFTPSISGASSNQAYAHLPQLVSRPAVEVTSGVVTQPSPLEVRPTGKKELPEDLFSAYYSSFPASVPGWQSGPPQGIGFNMQYNIAAPMPTFPQPSRSTNPFDFNNDPSSVQAPMFPSMASLQGALPNTGAPTGLWHTSSIGTPSQTWMPPHSSHVLAMPPQAPSYASAMPPSSYIGQQVPPNMQPRQQGVMSFGIEQPSFGSLNLNQHQGGLYSAPATPNTFSVGGNPFG